MLKIEVLDTIDFEINTGQFDEIFKQIPSAFLSKSKEEYTSKDIPHIMGRFLLSGLVSGFDHVNKLEIGYNKNGKPYFINSQTPLHFSISHSKSMVICGISDNEIGVDIQEISNCKLEVVKRFFAENEYDYLSEIDDENERNLQFTKLWSLKESIVKCKGEALALNLKKYNFTYKNGEFEPNFDTIYSLKCIKYNKNFVISHCLANEYDI